MYCPKCSQQQASDDVSFCTRCGFQLSIVKELLPNNGMLSAPATELSVGQPDVRLKRSRLGSKLLFFSIVMLPIFFVLAHTFDSPVPLFVPATIFLAGISCIAYFRIFGEDILALKNKAHAELSGVETNAPSLGVPSAIPVGELNAKHAGTAEMIQPPRSVVEHTTKLLNND
jgi:hypothetical protein